MSIAKLSFIVTAAAVVLAAINVIIRATTPDRSMLLPMILLGVTAAAFLFSLVVISGKKGDKKPDTAKDNAAEKTENE
ncbi:MAG: hypothetical protein IIW73_00015 [Clostridia bacterium]|nr:hypothetical protein [Clostridia bacterium]